MKIGKFNKSLFYFIIFSFALIIVVNIILKNERFKNIFTFFFVKNFDKNSFITYKDQIFLKDKLINDYLSKIPDIYISDKKREKERLNSYFHLYYFDNDPILKNNLKKKLLSFASKLKKKKVNEIDIIYLSRNGNFGNSLITINNCIFYCEILGCHRIILNARQTKRRWLIKNPIMINKLGIIIMQGSNIDCEKDNILCLYEIFWNIYYPIIVIPQVRIHLIKDELLRNLPYVRIEPESLYIHIRGGNVYRDFPPSNYAQPPLCFYEKIINNNKFKNIYIVSMDKTNIIINALINKYKHIILKKNHFEFDISLLAHAFNIVLSVSSFSLSSIKINNNLKNIWEYDIIRLSEKIHFLHHHFFKFKIRYTIHTMKPSNSYLSKMFSWKKSFEQVKLMLEDDCPYEFKALKPYI